MANSTQQLTQDIGLQQRRRIFQNYLVIWLNTDNHQQGALEELRSTINDIHIFDDVDQCIDFLTDIDNEHVFLIIPEILSEYLVPNIHDIPVLNSLYILSNNQPLPEEWHKQSLKLKSVYANIKSISELLQKAIKQCEQDSFPISFIPVNNGIINQNFDQLEPSFMYTQILKEILFEMTYNKHSIKDFSNYCRNGNYGSLININRFEQEYNSRLAIWWYTQPSFVFSMLNRALRMLETDTIIKMGFFINDLHCQIQNLYHVQLVDQSTKRLTVYRGQGLSIVDFNKLINTKGGLISFNNFLSTSKDRQVAVEYAESALTNPNLIGIIFKMTTDTSSSSVPFAAINEVSYFQTEEEVLFAMHTVFRIDNIQMIDNNDRFYQVELTITNDDDQQLRILTEYIRNETHASTGWERLANLLVSIGQYEKAEDFFKILLEQATTDEKKALFYNQLGHINDYLGDYNKALVYFYQSLDIKENNRPMSDPVIPTSYNNIGEVYRKMADHSEALSCYKKAIEISEKIKSSDTAFLADVYNNIGLVYKATAQYSQALVFLKKSLEIRQKILPANHPILGASYNCIAVVYDNMGEYQQALACYEKSIEIDEKSLPTNHPSFISSYNNIAHLYSIIGQSSKALPYHEKALSICQKSLPSNHPSLPLCYCNLGSIYKEIDFSKALSFYGKAIELGEKYFPQNHPNLASIYHNISGLYEDKREYSKALSFYEKAVEIYRKSLPSNHPLLATSYNNIGLIYHEIGDDNQALFYLEKALEIRQNTLSPQHLDIAQSYNNIASVYYHTGNYTKALVLLERALPICQRLLPENHPHLQYVRNGINMVKEKQKTIFI